MLLNSFCFWFNCSRFILCIFLFLLFCMFVYCCFIFKFKHNILFLFSTVSIVFHVSFIKQDFRCNLCILTNFFKFFSFNYIFKKMAQLHLSRGGNIKNKYFYIPYFIFHFHQNQLRKFIVHVFISS
jgi:hypothetical protein